MTNCIDRRGFIRDTAAITTGIAVAADKAVATQAAETPKVEFASRWQQAPDRVWLGADYWTNPLQDWRIAGGRIQCINAAADRNVHLLTRQLADTPGDLHMSVQVGRLDGDRLNDGKGSFGFRFGIQGPLADYRNSLLYGRGVDAGVTSDGKLFIGEVGAASSVAIDLGADSIELKLRVEPQGNMYQVTLAAYDVRTQRVLAEVVRPDLVAERLVGNVALVSNFGAALPAGAAKAKKKKVAAPNTVGYGKFWFANWRVTGNKVSAHDARAFGPILFSQYSLSRGVLKLSAQMPPLGSQDSPVVRLQVRDGNQWKTMAEEKIHPEARTATFRIGNWNDKSDVEFRLAYTIQHVGAAPGEHFWHGTIRRDPVDQPVLTVADISCNTHAAFPNATYVAHLAKLNPDLLAFVGDQFYESTGGYGVVRSPVDLAMLDYLRKWYIHGWTWSDLLRDRPSISIPDDHDVYQGNIWGESGVARQGTQEMGGYEMAPACVNVVHRTQTSHHPDPYDATPIQQDISTYYGPLTYGRVSFAVLADRMFKTGPEGVVPPTGGRGDHVTDPKFDPKSADVPGTELLGERQMKFLREWVTDWRGADMKAVISQTIFTALATTHGGGRERLVADYDTNGWPQTPRHEALRVIRKAFAMHLAGDQHLPAVIHYGIDQHRDAGIAFAGPAVNVGYPRWWEPAEPGQNRQATDPENTGDFRDHFGNPMSILAVKNGAVMPRSGVVENLIDRASGLGVVRFDKPNRRVIIECWPYLADPTTEAQFSGWPVTVEMREQYARRPAAHLPSLRIRGPSDPVVEIYDEKSGELVYSLRITGGLFQPHVFAEGKYTIRIGDPDRTPWQEFRGVEARVQNDATMVIDVERNR